MPMRTTIDDYVATPDMRILCTLAGLARHWGKRWCLPNQETILRLLQMFTGRRLSRRSLNRHLGALESAGWLERIRRHKKSLTGELELHSTVYVLKRRAWSWLKSFGVVGKNGLSVSNLPTEPPNDLIYLGVPDSAQYVTSVNHDLKRNRASQAPPKK